MAIPLMAIRKHITTVLAWLPILAAIWLPPAAPGAESDTIHIRQALALRIPAEYAETIVAPNPVEAALALGTFSRPHAGQSILFGRGNKATWEEIQVDSAGWFSSDALRKCYVYYELEVETPRIALLEAFGNEMVYVNGAPRSGNPYGLTDTYETWEPNFAYSRLPVQLLRGRNEFLFRCGRERLKARLSPPAKAIAFNTADMTLPDFVVGQPVDTRGAVVITNCSSKPLKDLLIESHVPGGGPVTMRVPVIQPYSVRKVGFRLVGPAPETAGTVKVLVEVIREMNSGKETLDEATIPLRIVGPRDNRKITFVSGIDNSVQYYSLLPSLDTTDRPQALVVSLHGASVEAINQTGSYAPKTWCHIVSPTNRRPYGFNWEDWGRLDALEVMGLAREKLTIDERSVYLTGHSMGGHGTWHLGTLFPDQFAAIAPSAGWISFWTYRFRGESVVDSSAVRAMIRRSTTPSETFRNSRNLADLGVYVLHGSDDDNVLVNQARMMVDTLRTFHRDFVWHEQPGVGHWWDLSDERGADCVDWPPMFDFFARHARPLSERIRTVHFTTPNPGITARSNWLTIDAQERQLLPSTVEIRFDPWQRRFTGRTDNVARLAVDLGIVTTPGPITLVLDGQTLVVPEWTPEQLQIWAMKEDGAWTVSRMPAATSKGSRRYGTFKDAFRNRMVFVYGTRGSREENRWAFEKARFDAEKFWYQGNGSVDVMADTDFDPLFHPDRNVILYGNRSTNLAWKSLLGDSPVQVERGGVQVGEKRFRGDNLSCLFVRPRKDDPVACVGVVSGSGIDGMRAVNRLPYMSPGIGLPDCTVLSFDVLSRGDDGVLLTGFFGLDWSVDTGEWAGQ